MVFDEFQVYLALDYETYSEANLKKVGAFEYSIHPSTEIICASWRLGTRATLAAAPTKTWVPGRDSHLDLWHAFTDPDVILVAHNALFEQVITRNVFAEKYLGTAEGASAYALEQREKIRSLAPQRWLCTASLASALALPRKLADVAAVLKLPVQKDMDGHRLMLKWCKPRKPTKNNPSTRHTNPDELKRLVSYCATDTDAETLLLLKLPELSGRERKVWCLDQAINLRGFRVDRPLVKTVLQMIAEETVLLNSATSRLSRGTIRSTKQRDATLDWLSDQGAYFADLTKKTVEDALAVGDLPKPVKRMLEIRQAASKSSTAKYQAFEMRSRHDGAVRDILVYHAASTGRWGGAGIQPQNLPRPTISDAIGTAEVLRDCDLEMVRTMFGDPMEVFASCLRSMIIARKGTTLDVMDFASIEARVLFWVARHEEGLKAFREGRDLYVEQAADAFQIPAEEIAKDSLERFVGKTLILGAGFGMGKDKFRGTCAAQGKIVSEEIAELGITSYREKHAPVVKLWRSIERAAISAVENLGKRFTVNRTSWWVRGEYLWCQLPSGRRLAYFGPAVKHEPTPWGERRPVLYHWGADAKTKRWVFGKTYGGRLVENVVQAIARDLMSEAMLRIDARGPWQLVLCVHDELVAERPLKGPGSLGEFQALMEQLPLWADGIPVKTEGWSGRRYRK